MRSALLGYACASGFIVVSLARFCRPRVGRCSVGYASLCPPSPPIAALSGAWRSVAVAFVASLLSRLTGFSATESLVLRPWAYAPGLANCSLRNPPSLPPRASRQPLGASLASLGSLVCSFADARLACSGGSIAPHASLRAAVPALRLLSLLSLPLLALSPPEVACCPSGVGSGVACAVFASGSPTFLSVASLPTCPSLRSGADKNQYHFSVLRRVCNTAVNLR